MPPHRVIPAKLGALLDTLGQRLLVYGVAPLMAGPALEVAALRDCPCAPGLLLHPLSGNVLFPLGLLALPAHDMPGPPRLRGRHWAECLWLALATLVAPRLGAGRFRAAQGGREAALRALAEYLVSSATLGGRGGAPAPTDRETAPSWFAGPREADLDGAP
jgi:hypothetical protein